MQVKTKQVFYCGFCPKKGLSRHAMEKHESHCTLNPERTCRWQITAWDGKTHPQVALSSLITQIKERAPLVVDDIDWLRKEVEGCPACMLAVLRQSGEEYHYGPNSTGPMFDYQEEVKRFREDERIAWEQEARRAIESSWL